MDTAIGFPNTSPLDSDIFGGWCYPTFEQSRPGLYFNRFVKSPLHRHVCESMGAAHSGSWVPAVTKNELAVVCRIATKANRSHNFTSKKFNPAN